MLNLFLNGFRIGRVRLITLRASSVVNCNARKWNVTFIFVEFYLLFDKTQWCTTPIWTVLSITHVKTDIATNVSFQHWFFTQRIFSLRRLLCSSLAFHFIAHRSCRVSWPVSFSVGAELKSRLKFYVHFCFQTGVSQNQPEQSSLTTKIRESNPQHC